MIPCLDLGCQWGGHFDLLHDYGHDVHDHDLGEGVN